MVSNRDGKRQRLQPGMLSVCLREEKVEGPPPAAPESAGAGAAAAAGGSGAEALPPGPAPPAPAATAEGPESLNFEAFSLLEEGWHGRPSRGGAARGICSIQ